MSSEPLQNDLHSNAPAQQQADRRAGALSSLGPGLHLQYIGAPGHGEAVGGPTETLHKRSLPQDEQEVRNLRYTLTKTSNVLELCLNSFQTSSLIFMFLIVFFFSFHGKVLLVDGV